MDVAAQIADLTRRVAALEAEAQGQQRYNARILGMLTELRDDVAIVRSHAVGLGQRFDALEAKVGGLETKVERLEAKVDKLEAGLEGVRADIAGLRRDLPGIIAETMREVLREGK
jgi:outer membrane murein-binding lipoprotein Lpp